MIKLIDIIARRDDMNGANEHECAIMRDHLHSLKMDLLCFRRTQVLSDETKQYIRAVILRILHTDEDIADIYNTKIDNSYTYSAIWVNDE